jgi:hypothetical protein
VEVFYANSLCESIRLCTKVGVELRQIFLSYDSLIQNARNDLVAITLRNGFDDLIFIDADQEWEPEWILKLLSYPVDCVGAPVRKKSDAQELYNVKSSTFNIPVDLKTGLLMVDALGCGFIRYSRKALQTLWDHSEKYRISGGDESAWIFDIRPVNGVLVGEDTMVGMKLKEHGIQTYLDQSMNPGHVGVKKWTGNFADWLARAQAQHLPERKIGVA